MPFYLVMRLMVTFAVAFTVLGVTRIAGHMADFWVALCAGAFVMMFVDAIGEWERNRK